MRFNSNPRRIPRIVIFVCALILAATSFSAVGYGADPIHKVTFYQVAMDDNGTVITDSSAFSVAYSTLTQFPSDGNPARNPGAVTYGGGTPSSYHFIGWYEFGAPIDQPYDFGSPVKGDLTLFARFSSGYLVTFMNGKGEAFLTKNVAPGEKVSEPTDGEMSLFETPDGENFDGVWLNGSAPYDFDSTPVTEDLTLKPKLSPGYTIFFVSEGSQVAPVQVNMGDSATPPTNPVRPGYAFKYWSTAEDGSAEFDFSDTITADTTLHAVWEAETIGYTIAVWREKKNIAGDVGNASNFNPANFEYIGRIASSALAGSDVPSDAQVQTLIPASPYKTSWSEFAFMKPTSAKILGNGATILNVYYKRTVYDFSFTPYNNSNATANASMTLGGRTYTNASRYSFSAKYEQDVSAVWPVRPLAQVNVPGSNLMFQGWRVPNGNTTFVSKVVTMSTDLLPASGTLQTVSAVYLTSGMTVNLHYMFEDVTGVPGAVTYNGKSYAQDDTYSQSAFSAGTPFSLKEIKGMKSLTSNALQRSDGAFTTVPSRNTLTEQYLFYDRIRYTITFIDPQGFSNVPAVGGLLPGDLLSAHKPADPVKAGYEFDGWYTDSSYAARFDCDAERMPDSNVSLYAKWIAQPRTVYVYDGFANAPLLGTYKKAGSGYVGDPNEELEAVGTNVDYTPGTLYPGKGTFVGWVIPIGPGKTAPLSPEIPMSNDISVYALWDPGQFRVTYDAGNADSGAPPVDSGSYQRGTEARLLEPAGSAAGAGSLVPPTGKEFIGWSDGDGRILYPGQTIEVTKDIQLTAVYEEVLRVAIYSYHINYPAGAKDRDGKAITDPGIIRQYVLQGSDFNVIGYEAYSRPEPVTYRFAGWAERADAGTAKYAGGEEITATTGAIANLEVHLYAVWAKEIPVVFDAVLSKGAIKGSEGSSIVTYMIPSGSSLSAQNITVPGVNARDDYEYNGWGDASSTPVSDNDISDANVTGPVTYTAIYSELSPGIKAYYFGVTFDSGGEKGNLAGGSRTVTYGVVSGGSLSANAGLSSLPEVEHAQSYDFVGWAPSGYTNEDDILNDDGKRQQLLNKAVTGPAVYEAVYAGQSPAIEARYHTVIFDAGGVYGHIDMEDKPSSAAITVPKGTSLGGIDVFRAPAVVATVSGISFIGWSPDVDIETPVNETRIYTARYAFTPTINPYATYYSVRFEIGEFGAFKDDALTEYIVEAGTSLGAVGTSLGAVGTFVESDYGINNIDVRDGYEFAGWSPSLDKDAPVNSPVIYRAQYAHITTVTPPGPSGVQAQGYDVYYDGQRHGIEYSVGSGTDPDGIVSLWVDITNGKRSGAVWNAGIPEDEVNVSNKEYDVVFMASGKMPTEIELDAVIKPRPLVPKATHADITVGTGLPLRESYGLTMDYNGRDKAGDPIGDNFDFSTRTGEFAYGSVPVTTTYEEGDPAGDYPIYVKAGVYGNYEIYEGTEGAWPLFAGWRFAGILHVTAQTEPGADPGGDPGSDPGGDPGGGTPSNPDTGSGDDADDADDADDDYTADGSEDDSVPGGGAADTGDSFNPTLWMALFFASFMSLATLLLISRRGRRSNR
jgi:uncharacterized repeat protein (TIGR02543 family)